jgi:hypothetical protein
VTATILKEGAPATFEYSVEESDLARLLTTALTDWRSYGRTDQDGKLKVCGLPSGEFHLNVAQSFLISNSQAYQYSASTSFAIDRDDVALGEIAALPPVTIAADIAWDSGHSASDPLPRARLSVWPPPLRPRDGETKVSTPSLQILPTEHYSLSVAGLTSPVYAKDILSNGISVKYEAFLSPPVTNAHFTIVLADDGATVTAKARDISGVPAPRAVVLLVPLTARSEQELAVDLVVGLTNESGETTFWSVPPGTYAVTALATPPPLVFQNNGSVVLARTPETLAKFLNTSDGTKVTVAPRGAMDVAVTLK